MRGLDVIVFGRGKSSVIRGFVIGGLGMILLILLLLVYASHARAGKSVVSSVSGAESGTLGGQFNGPGGIAVNQNGTGNAGVGDFFVADSANNRIQQFDAAGSFIRTWGQNVAGRDERQLIAVSGVNSGAGGGTFTLTFGACTTANIAANATATAVQTALNAAAMNACTSGAGNISVTGNAANGWTVRFIGALSGTDVAQLTASGAGLVGPSPAISVSTLEGGSGGNFTGFETCTVASACQDGIITPTTANGGQLSSPQGIAIGQTDGAIYVTEQGSRRVQKFTLPANPADPVLFDRAWGADVNLPAGGSAFEICTVAANCKTAATGTTAGGGALGANLGYLAVVPTGAPGAGEIVVADAGNRRVQRYEPDGDFVHAFGWDVDSAGLVGQLEKCTTTCRAGTPAGTAVGQFPNNQPTRVAVDSNGFIYTVESASPFRLQRFNPAITSALNFCPDQTGGTGATTSPTDVYINPGNDNVYVSKGVPDTEDRDGDGNTTEVLERRILQLDSLCTLVDAHGVGSLLPSLNGLGVKDSSGRIYVSASHRVFILDTPVPPTATIDPVTTFTANSATFTGSVNPNGLQTNYRFEYSSDDFATVKSAPLTDADAGPVGSNNAVQQDVVGLEPNTTYEVRLVATKSFGGGTVTTAPQPFTTTATQPRMIAAGTFPGGSDTGVILFATIDPEGQPTTYHFEYGTDASYGQSTPVESAGAGNAEQVQLVRLNGLDPDTTYHFKAVATNPSGTVESGDETFSTAASAPCPNESLRFGVAAKLPACRAYEMVSPIDKNGGDIETAEQEAGLGSHLASAYRQASVNGGKITYSSATAFGDAIGGHWSNQYLATRGDAGWSTHAISSRRGRTVVEPAGSFNPNLRWFNYEFFQGFTPDLSTAWVRDDNVDPLTPDALQGYANLYRRDNGNDSYQALTTGTVFGSTALPVLSGDKFSNVGGPRVLGASDDLRHQVFVANAALTPNASGVVGPGGLEGPVSQLYDLVDGQLHLVSVLPNGATNITNSFAGTSSTSKFVTTNQQMLKNVVSDDGSRIVWSASSPEVTSGAGPGTIYVRENPAEAQSALGPGNECTEPAKACTVYVGGQDSPVSARAQFWAASSDVSKILYSTGTYPSRTLQLFDVDAKTTVQIAGKSAGVSATADDLSHIYFVSQEALASGAVAGQNNLYDYNEGDYLFVGPVAADDIVGEIRIVGGGEAYSPNIVGIWANSRVGPVYRSAGATPDGHHFTFMSSSAALSEGAAGYDNADVVTGKPAFEVYRYDAEDEALACVSCNPSGARPRGTLLKAPYSPVEIAFTSQPDRRVAASIPTQEHDNYELRILSDDGNRLFFHSDEALLPRDVNGVQDVYQWQAVGSGGCDSGDTDYFEQNGGCLYLISTGADDAYSEFVDADPAGDEVFFTTDSGIDPRDPGLRDIYVAKAGGGFPLPHPTAPCEGDACQSPPPPPSDPTPASAAFQGPGDPAKKGKPKPSCPKGKRKIKARNGKTRCVKPKKRSAKRAKRANNDRRAAR